jgi:hypothetical protein
MSSMTSRRTADGTREINAKNPRKSEKDFCLDWAIAGRDKSEPSGYQKSIAALQIEICKQPEDGQGRSLSIENPIIRVAIRASPIRSLLRDRTVMYPQ